MKRKRGRPGRPVSQDPTLKDAGHIVTFRLFNDEWLEFRMRAFAHGRTPSQEIRQVVQDYLKHTSIDERIREVFMLVNKLPNRGPKVFAAVAKASAAVVATVATGT